MRRLLLACLLFAASPLLAEEPPVSGEALGQLRVSALRPDGVLELEDGRLARLAGLMLPRPLLNGKGPANLAAQSEARKLLSGLAVGQTLTFSLSGSGDADRWNRLPVQAMTASGQWLQAELLRKGLARVMPEDGQDDALLDRLLEAEAQARTAGLGLWSDEAFHLRSPEEAGRWLDSFQLFEGVVTSANLAKGFVYVNFSEDWKRGLSLKIPRSVRKSMPGDPLGLTGRRLLVRGWVGKGSGPMIEIRHPRQIELRDGVWPAKMVADPPKDPA